MTTVENGEMPIVSVRREPDALDLPLPAYATPGAAGIDVYCAVARDEPLTLLPGERALVPTGIRIAVPTGFEAQVRARSGLAVRHGIGLVNAPGTIDSDYRGIVQVLLINWGAEPFTLRRGDRIAQLVIAPVAQARLIEANLLPDTLRGEGGFGSTGTS